MFPIYLNLETPWIPILMLCLEKNLKMCLPKAFNIWQGFLTLTEKQASSYSYCAV